MTRKRESTPLRSPATSEYKSTIEEYIRQVLQCRDDITRAYDSSRFAPADEWSRHSRPNQWLCDVPRLGNQALVAMTGICSFLVTNGAEQPGFLPVLAAIQKLQLYRDPQLHIHNLTSEAIDDLETIEKLLAGLRPRQRPKRDRRPAAKGPSLARIHEMVRGLRDEGKSFEQICAVLANSDRPSEAKWKLLPWPQAYRDLKYRAAVKTWLSKAINRA